MAERLQSVESTRRRLFGDLAHEIRTPVAVLEGYLEAVEDGVKTLDPQTMAMLREQTGRLVRFSADAAALAQAEEAHAAITPGWVDIDDLITTVRAAAADRYAGKSVTLHTQACGGRLWADRLRLTQVLGNLLDNALRHTPPRAGTSGSRQPRPAPMCCLPSPTTARASPPSTCRMSSSASTAPTWPGTAITGAPESDWPSPRR